MKQFKGATPTPSPAQAIEGFKILINAYKENHKVTEEEKTKRKNIAAMKEYEIEKIHAQKEVLKDYFEKTFAERRINFDKMFDSLDKGIENNNTQAIQASMSMIVALSQESPLKDVQSLVSNFNNPDVESITI
jgi:hypothetical protein